MTDLLYKESLSLLYREYERRLQNVDDALDLGLYDSFLDASDHKARIDLWFNEQVDIIKGHRQIASS